MFLSSVFIISAVQLLTDHIAYCGVISGSDIFDRSRSDRGGVTKDKPFMHFPADEIAEESIIKETVEINDHSNKESEKNSDNPLPRTNDRLSIVFGQESNSGKNVISFTEKSTPKHEEHINIFFPTIRSTSSSDNESFVDVSPDKYVEEYQTPPSKCNFTLGLVEYQGICELIFSQSLCEENEWLVLTKPDDEAKCQPRPCPLGSVNFKNECVGILNFTGCRPGEMLYVDFYGVAECDCEPSFFYMPFQDECVMEHEQGQCSFGQYVEVSDETGIVDCVKNPCYLDTYVFDNTTSRCFQKDYRGRCRSLVTINTEKKVAECWNFNAQNIFEVATLRSCPTGSRRDYRGRCRRSYHVPTQYSSPSFSGRCRSGYTKDKSGTCRKVQKLFG